MAAAQALAGIFNLELIRKQKTIRIEGKGGEFSAEQVRALIAFLESEKDR